jgi:hypothetical protein
MPYLENSAQESIREFVFADLIESDVDTTAIRNKTHKLIHFYLTGIDELYNLESDPYDHNNLFAETLSCADQQQYDMLKIMCANLKATVKIYFYAIAARKRVPLWFPLFYLRLSRKWIP